MNLGIINSAFSQVGVDTETGLEAIARIGFDTVDIATEAMTLTSEEKRSISRICQRTHLAIVSLPVVAAGLIDFHQVVRTFHIDRCKRFIDLAHDLGARNLLLVLGEYIWQREVIPPSMQWQWGLEGCRILGDYAAAKGLQIVLELEPFRMSLLNNVDEMVRFLTECAHSHVKANIDISHLVLADCGPESIAKLRGMAAHVHISDCNGQVHGDLPPGRGIVKFTPYLEAIKSIGVEGTISIELEFSPEPAAIIAWVEEAYEQTDRLMSLVGLRSKRATA